MPKLETELGVKQFETQLKRAFANIEFTAKWLKKSKSDAIMNGIELPIPEHKLREYKKVKRRKQLPKSETLLAQHAEVLMILLKANSPLSLRLIQAEMVDKSSDISRLVEKLELLDLVANVRTRGNMRQHDIALTEYGTEIANKVKLNLVQYEQEISRKLMEFDLIQINTLLDMLR